MAFDRPTLSELMSLVAQDIAAELPGSDPLLRHSNLNVLGRALSGLAHLHYGFLDWISRQAVPYTAEREYLRAWAALKGVTPIPPAQAAGAVTFAGVNGVVLPAGTPLTRGDGKTFTTTTEGTVVAGHVTVNAIADADPNGETGAWGNMDVGSSVSLGVAIVGINSTGSVSTAFTGGADIEQEDAMRERMLRAWRDPSRGGSPADYVEWALKVPGVSRAWCPASTMGSGTVQVFFMMDDAQAAHGGFPQGTNGVATAEYRDTPATGDQLAVANAIYPLRPATALVYAVTPTAYACNFTISGLLTASSDTRAAVTAAIAAVLTLKGDLGGTVAISDVETAVTSVANTGGFVITSPVVNMTAPAGQIHTLGTITWT